MRLFEVDSREDMERGLKGGDPDLERDIERAVGKKIWSGEPTPEWEIGMETEEMTSMVEDPSDIVDHLGRRAAAELEGVPVAVVIEALGDEIQEAAVRHTTRGGYRGTPLLAFTSGQGSGLTLRPVMVEHYVAFDDLPLRWVPEERLAGFLKDAGPGDAEWQTGDGLSYTSGWTDAGDYWRLEVDYNQAQEWAYDLRQNYLSGMVDAKPEEAIAAFMDVLHKKYPELAKRLKKAKLPKDLLADYAVAYFSDPAEGLEIIAEAMGEWGYKGSRGETLLEIDRAALQAMGITEGRWWDAGPWRLVNLPPEELAYEGTLMRHCVGRFDFGYRDAVKRGDSQIWSLRSRHNKPILTFEVDLNRWKAAGVWPSERGAAIQQLKGKLNREPGVDDLQERAVLHWIFARLDIDPRHVDDLGWDVEPGPLSSRGPNPGFDAPWRNYPERARARLLRY